MSGADSASKAARCVQEWRALCAIQRAWGTRRVHLGQVLADAAAELAVLNEALALAEAGDGDALEALVTWWPRMDSLCWTARTPAAKRAALLGQPVSPPASGA